MLPSERPTSAWIALGAGLLMQALAIGALWGTAPSPQAAARPHTSIPGLRSAPQAHLENDLSSWLSVLYSASIALTLLALLALGLRGGRSLGRIRTSFALASALFLGAFAALWSSYFRAPEGSALWGLPAATAWLLFGVWPAEALFVAVFLRHFRSAYWSTASQQRLDALLNERAAAAQETQEL